MRDSQTGGTRRVSEYADGLPHGQGSAVTPVTASFSMELRAAAAIRGTRPRSVARTASPRVNAIPSVEAKSQDFVRENIAPLSSPGLSAECCAIRSLGLYATVASTA